MPAGSFMEAHTNRHHLAGWRFYFQYLPEAGQSVFYYRHCHDKSLHAVPDSNLAGNMFRIRKLPDTLLWHSIVADTPRMAWGIYLCPELAQHLKSVGQRM